MIAYQQTVKKLLNELMISVVSGVPVAFISGTFLGKVLGILIFGLWLAATIAYLLLYRYKRLFKFMKAVRPGYYFSFDLSENAKVFSKANDSLCYMGISANSILEIFRNWISENRHINDYKFLLMDPESEELKRQIAFQNGVSLDTKLSSIDSRLLKVIEDETEAEKKSIRSSIEMLKTLQPFKEGKIKIRLHKKFIPWWMYVLDDKVVYLGILKKGKRGQGSPVMTISKVSDFPSPFDLFKNTWDSMWSNATEV